MLAQKPVKDSESERSFGDLSREIEAHPPGFALFVHADIYLLSALYRPNIFAPFV